MLPAVLEDKYELLRLLGKGGMGAVHEARHLQIGRHVAIKLMGEAVVQSEEARRRFLREAQVAGTLDHENICPVTDMGETAEGVPYLVMPLLKGQNLAAELEFRQGALEAHRAVDIVCQVLAGLEVAHAANVLHRDLKPDNIFLVQRPGKSDLVKLLDFGISKIVTPVGASTELTGTGMVVGTPAYLAPEQAMATGELDQRVDVYGAAVVLYQLLTGRRPFEARSYNEMIVKICTEPFDMPRTFNGTLDADLERVLLRGMARDPSQRWPSASAFRQALLGLSSSIRPVSEQATELLVTAPAPAPGTTPSPVITPQAEEAQQVATAQTVLAQSADLKGLVHTPTAAGQVNLAAVTAESDTPSPGRRGGLWGGLFALVGVLAGAGVVLLYLSLREERPRPPRDQQVASAMSPSPQMHPEPAPDAMAAVDPTPSPPSPAARPATPPASMDTMGAAATTMRSMRRSRPRARPKPQPQAQPQPRQQSRPHKGASTQPSGGKTARMRTLIGYKTYKPAYIRSQFQRIRSRINRCYAKYQFNGVHHVYSMYKLRISAEGKLLSVYRKGTKPVGKGLEACTIRALHSITWKPPMSGAAGWIEMGFTARIPRSRPRSD